MSTATVPCSVTSLRAPRWTTRSRGSCPAKFRAEYLPAGEMPHCIDFTLTAGEIKAQDAEVLFTGRQVLRSGTGYVSDHLGLLARLNCLGA